MRRNVSNTTKTTEAFKEVEKKTGPGTMPIPGTGPSRGPALPTESQLISFGDRITYVFAHGKDVGSIHFDRGKGEIFYKGHNIRNMDLEEWQMQVMESLRKILAGDKNGKAFADSYGRLLDKIILEKKNPRKL